MVKPAALYLLLTGLTLLGLTLVVGLTRRGTAPARSGLVGWTQYGPRGLEARVITDQAACPMAEIDGVATAMLVRAAPGADYPMLVCALPVPLHARIARVAGQSLTLGVAVPQRIAVIGDTGCRLKDSYLQPCNDPARWPFKLLAESVAAARPDLIIHVGDYHYRETACPRGLAGCAGSPFGDTWAAWRADFFAPAATLLGVAPWVMVRGNHETCDRAGKGWSRTLDPALFDANAGCTVADAPYAVPFGNASLVVLDVTSAKEPRADPEQARHYEAQYRSIPRLVDGPTWILQHRPIWSPGGTVAGLHVGDNKTLALAARDALPAQVNLILSGHHHLFQVLGYREDLPAQIVAGHGGDTLNRTRTTDPTGWTINGVTVKSGFQAPGQFGFALLEPRGAGWNVTDYDVRGTPLRTCSLTGRDVVCNAP